jgi:hypothetical protein
MLDAEGHGWPSGGSLERRRQLLEVDQNAAFVGVDDLDAEPLVVPQADRPVGTHGTEAMIDGDFRVLGFALLAGSLKGRSGEGNEDGAKGGSVGPRPER